MPGDTLVVEILDMAFPESGTLGNAPADGDPVNVAAPTGENKDVPADEVAGALFSLGDVHARQGDGEVVGAPEMAARTAVLQNGEFIARTYEVAFKVALILLTMVSKLSVSRTGHWSIHHPVVTSSFYIAEVENALAGYRRS